MQLFLMRKERWMYTGKTHISHSANEMERIRGKGSGRQHCIYNKSVEWKDPGKNIERTHRRTGNNARKEKWTRTSTCSNPEKKGTSPPKNTSIMTDGPASIYFPSMICTGVASRTCTRLARFAMKLPRQLQLHGNRVIKFCNGIIWKKNLRPCQIKSNNTWTGKETPVQRLLWTDH